MEQDEDRLNVKIELLQEELEASRGQIGELEAKAKTSLSGAQFLTLVLVGPLFMAFVATGVLIVYKTLSRPAEVAPHLDIILVSFAIFANPVTAAAASIVSLMSDEIKSKLGVKKDE
tara:strand:+ start:31 stop:381 length:351 start_codon:yes stop_codon:yes gene_type:complete